MASGGRHGTLTLIVLAVLGIIALVGFIRLGNWQLERRVWKLDLMQKVAHRVHAPPQQAPGPSQWLGLTRASSEYQHVAVTGHFLPNNNTLVVAATELGSGYWVISPLQRSDNSIVFINRGFIGQGVKPPEPPTGQVTVTGLLRFSEPTGSVLRDNKPALNRWYSRDVAAIAAEQKLNAAPYFIDAAKGEPGSSASQGPRGGLTVIRFHNNHLIYALTWYSLAIMVIVAGVIVIREERKSIRQP